jgi:hypothetical protein
MSIIKEDAKMLTEEGNLITKIKGINNENDANMDEYVGALEKIIAHKINSYKELQSQINIYK